MEEEFTPQGTEHNPASGAVVDGSDGENGRAQERQYVSRPMQLKEMKSKVAETYSVQTAEKSMKGIEEKLGRSMEQLEDYAEYDVKIRDKEVAILLLQKIKQGTPEHDAVMKQVMGVFAMENFLGSSSGIPTAVTVPQHFGTKTNNDEDEEEGLLYGTV